MRIPFTHARTCIRLLSVLTIGFTTLCSIGQSQEPAKTAPSKLTKRVIGDYSYSSRSQTPPYTSKQIPYSKFTHIIHFGVGFYSDGTLYVDPAFPEPNLIRQAHKNGVKVLLAACGPYSVFDNNPDRIEAFAANLAVFVNEHGYDGVDIDWEYPTAAETNTFYSLMTALRSRFPSPAYLISADVPPWGDDGVGSGYDIPQVDSVLDYFNIMMYACAGPWTDDGQLNSPIFWDPSDPEPWECEPGGSAQEAVAIFTQEGVPPAQLNMGTPFGGFLYANVRALWGECSNASQTKDGNCDWSVYGENYGTFFKQRINQQGWETFYDPVALVPYMLRADGTRGFGTYDDEFSTYYRVWYSDWVANLGGTFIWSIDQDYDGTSQDLLDAVYAASLPPTN
jgi:chitinase